MQLNLFNYYFNLFRTARPVIKINITEVALSKMTALVDAFEGEVGWHGTVNKLAENFFEIDDIIVYPQDASAASIYTDQRKYEMWLMGQPDDIFNRLRMHGHSHVNFSATPSSKDDRHREGLTAHLLPGMFYLFLILNKAYKTHTYVHYKPGIALGPENIRLYATVRGKRTLLKNLSRKTLGRLLDNQPIRDFVSGAKKIVNEGRVTYESE